LTAGPGKYDGHVGSPVIFHEEIEDVGMPYSAFLFEREQKSYESLGKYFEGMKNSGQVTGKVEIVTKPYQDGKKYTGFKLPRYGLIYIDPSGGMPDFDYLGDISKYKANQYMDFLINISATNVKRIRKSPNTDFSENLIELLDKVIKNTGLSVNRMQDINGQCLSALIGMFSLSLKDASFSAPTNQTGVRYFKDFQ
jgi:hypothetical protein